MRHYVTPIEEILLAQKCGFLSKKIWRKFINQRKDSARKDRWRGFLRRNIFKPYGFKRGDDILYLNSESEIVKSVVGGDIMQPPPSYILKHDEIVVDIVLEWAKDKGIDNYYFENELRSAPKVFGLERYDKLPDAILEVDNARYAVEVEISKKYSERYRKALNAYAMSKRFKEIHYFTNSLQIKNSLLTASEDVEYPQNKQPIIFHMLELSGG